MTWAPDHTERRDDMARRIADVLVNATTLGQRAAVVRGGNIIILGVDGTAYTITVNISRYQPKEGMT